MRLTSLLPFALASTTLAAVTHKWRNDAYMRKLDKVTSRVLLHETTGVEAGLDVCTPPSVHVERLVLTSNPSSPGS